MKIAIVEYWEAIAHWADRDEVFASELTEEAAERARDERPKKFGDPIRGFSVRRRTQTGHLITVTEK